MRYRVEDLATAAAVSVDTIRYYQSLDLLASPQREGRAAWYDESHLQALARIRDLKEQGFTLAMIARVLSGELDAGEEALAAAIVRPATGAADVPAQMDLAELGAHTGVSQTVLQAVARQGILIAPADQGPYTPADAEAVLAGKALLDAGVPISELLALAREHDAAIAGIAHQAVDLFARFVRDPIRARVADQDEAAQQMVQALQQMLPAATDIIAHTFRRRLLQAARERLEADAADDDARGVASS
ncbi:MAG TPA: MerR family transcriptional regulator [Euzebya sp.]|nr:MerR family transcriptional regulator [Euzebya sp.]